MSADPSNANTSLSGGNGTGSPKTAPSVGMHHKKTNSLVGFDPLLGDGIAGAAGGGSGSSPKQQQHAPVGTGSMGGIGADDILAALYGPPSSPGGAGADAGLNTSMNSKSSSSRHSRVRSFGGFGSGSRTPPRTPIKLQPKLNNNSLQKSPKTAPAANSKNNNGSQQQVSPKELAQNLRELANAIDRTSLTPPPPGPPLSDSGKNTASKSGGAATATPTSTPGRMKIKLPWKKKKKDQPATKMMMPAANAPAPSAVAPPPDFDSIGNDAQKQASTRPARAKCQSVDFAAESYDWIYTLAAADGAGNSNGNGSNGLAKPSSAAALGSAATATTAVAGMAVPSSASGTLTSPMIQELYYSSTDAAMNDLSLPSLSKPRATSFLTGKETNFRTTEQDATDFQVQIPPRADVEACSRLCQFIDTYRDEGRGFDLNDLVGIPSLELSRFAKGDASAVDLKGVKDCFRPVVENLLECAPDDFVGVKAHCMTGDSRKGDDPGSRREFLIIERQRQLLVCFRGTKSEQQQGKYTGSGSAANKQQAQQLGEPVKLQENDGAEVFGDKVAALKEDDLELLTFRKLDELAEESPFLDIAFTGYSYGAALASLAAYRYAFGRQDIRVQVRTHTCVVCVCFCHGSTQLRISPSNTAHRRCFQFPQIHNKTGRGVRFPQGRTGKLAAVGSFAA